MGALMLVAPRAPRSARAGDLRVSAAQAGEPAGLLVDALAAALGFVQRSADSERAKFPPGRGQRLGAFRAFCRRPIRPHREMLSGSVAAPQRPAGGLTALAPPRHLGA